MTAIYVEIRQYRSVLDSQDTLKSKLLAAKRVLHELHDIRNEENKELHRLEAQLKEMRGRLEGVRTELMDE